jgi:hypothetical protein
MYYLLFVLCARLFPAFQNIRKVSQKLAARVAEEMVRAGLGARPPGCVDWEAYVASQMWTVDNLKQHADLKQQQQHQQQQGGPVKILSKL